MVHTFSHANSSSFALLRTSTEHVLKACMTRVANKWTSPQNCCFRQVELVCFSFLRKEKRGKGDSRVESSFSKRAALLPILTRTFCLQLIYSSKLSLPAWSDLYASEMKKVLPLQFNFFSLFGLFWEKIATLHHLLSVFLFIFFPPVHLHPVSVKRYPIASCSQGLSLSATCEEPLCRWTVRYLAYLVTPLWPAESWGNPTSPPRTASSERYKTCPSDVAPSVANSLFRSFSLSFRPATRCRTQPQPDSASPPPFVSECFCDQTSGSCVAGLNAGCFSLCLQPRRGTRTWSCCQTWLSRWRARGPSPGSTAGE